MRRAQFYWRGAYGMVICSSNIASADEGGISFWIPGLYVVSAVPQVPSWLTGVRFGSKADIPLSSADVRFTRRTLRFT